MRLFPLLLLMLAGSLIAAEPLYPLWDGHESVADYAKNVNLPPTKTLDLANGVKLELVLIPAGKFMMGTPEPTPVDEEAFFKKIIIGQAMLAACTGSLLVMLAFVLESAIRKRRRPQLSLRRLLLVTVASGGCVLSGLHWRQSAKGLEAVRVDYAAAKMRCDAADNTEKPAHPVILTKPFYLGKFPVTQEQYQAVTGSNPSCFKGKDNPVEQVSWDDAQAFCKKLTDQTKQTGRLPTAAEWEYSCRAGTPTAYFSGDAETDLGRVAWYSANSNCTTHPVGQKEPNAFGLYDIHGNVWQWCQDWYAADYHGKSETENPRRPAQGSYRLLHGGAWDENPMRCRSAYRCRHVCGLQNLSVGFRIVLTPTFKAP